MSNRKRREPCDGFNELESKNESQSGSVRKKRKLIELNNDSDIKYHSKLQTKMECLKWIGITMEHQFNIKRFNIDKIKQYLILSQLNESDKNEILNDYLFYYRNDSNYMLDETEELENDYMSLSSLCKWYYLITKLNDINHCNILWIELIDLFICHGMNIFLDHNMPLHLDNNFVDQYIHKKTFQTQYIHSPLEIKQIRYDQLSLFSRNKEYKIIISAINQCSTSIPPMIDIVINEYEKWMNWRVNILGESCSTFKLSELSPNSLKIAIQYLSSMIINISDIHKFEQQIFKQYKLQIANIQNIEAHHGGYYNHCNALALMMLFVIKCFYQKYQENLISELKKTKYILPFDIINIIMKQYYFQNLSFLDEIKNFKQWFFIFFSNIHYLSEKWLNWIYHNYLHEIDKMVIESKERDNIDDNNYNINNISEWYCSVCTFSNFGGDEQCKMCHQGIQTNISDHDINLLSSEIANHIVSELNICKSDKMAIYILNSYRKCKLDSDIVSKQYILKDISMRWLPNCWSAVTMKTIERDTDIIKNRLDIIAKSVSNAWQIFEYLFFLALKERNYWVLIILILNNYINIEDYDIDQQLIEYEMNMEEIDEMGLIYELQLDGECERIESVENKCYKCLERRRFADLLQTKHKAKEIFINLISRKNDMI